MLLCLFLIFPASGLDLRAFDCCLQGPLVMEPGCLIDRDRDGLLDLDLNGDLFIDLRDMAILQNDWDLLAGDEQSP